MSPLAVIGLGNPGPRYELTRHNIGFLTVDALADRLGWPCEAERFQGLIAKGRWEGGETLILFKPQTFMNLSGEAVGRLARFHKTTPSNLLIIHDELDLPFGRIRFKMGGSDAGHNGLKSITERLGTRDFARLRMGVGRPADRRTPTDYLLNRFSDEEMDRLGPWLEATSGMVLDYFRLGLSAVQNRHHPSDFGWEHAGEKELKKE